MKGERGKVAVAVAVAVALFMVHCSWFMAGDQGSDSSKDSCLTLIDHGSWPVEGRYTLVFYFRCLIANFDSAMVQIFNF